MQQAKDDLQVRWLKLRIKIKERFGIKPEMDGILFLIGVQELGTGHREFRKEKRISIFLTEIDLVKQVFNGQL